MEKLWVLLLLTVLFAESFASPRGLIFNLENGELCFQSVQCKSGCCHKESTLSLSRCTDKAAENQECSWKHLNGIYSQCPCESGLTCNGNMDYGICHADPA